MNEFEKLAVRLSNVAARAARSAAPVAAAPAVNPAAANALLERKIVRQGAIGEMPKGLVPEHLRKEVAERKGVREVAKARLEGMKATRPLREAASTPERQQALNQLGDLPKTIDGKVNPAYQAAQKSYQKMPHAPDHQAKLLEAQQAAKNNYAAVAKEQDRAFKAQKKNKDFAMPEHYQQGQAMARAGYDLNNQWHKAAPAVGALAGGALGALSADTENGESMLGRGLAGAAVGGGLGYGIRQGAPRVAGWMHPPAPPAPPPAKSSAK